MKKVGYITLAAVLFTSGSTLPMATPRWEAVERLASNTEGLNSDATTLAEKADRLATWAQERDERLARNLFIAGGVTLVATVATVAYANFETKREKRVEEAKFDATVKN
jgi:hypothetical protein